MSNSFFCVKKNLFFKRVKPLGVIALAFVLQGCVTSGGAVYSNNAPTSEALLIAAENHAGLIDFYREQLENTPTTQESDELRLKLSETYLNMGDPDSTLFYLQPLTEAGRANAGVLLLKSRALLAMKKYESSMETAQNALAMDDGNPNIHNQLGLIYAQAGDYNRARWHFNQARVHWLDDVTVKNNLAMMDILEGKYPTAVARLMPVYLAGQADDKVIANLVVALARSGQYQEFKSVYSNARNEEEYRVVFHLIATMNPTQLLEMEG